MPFYYEQASGGFGTGARQREQERAAPGDLTTDQLLDQLDPVELFELQQALTEARATRDQTISDQQSGFRQAVTARGQGLFDNELTYQDNYRSTRQNIAGNNFRRAGGFDRAITEQAEGLARSNDRLNASFDNARAGFEQNALLADDRVRSTRLNSDLALTLQLARLGVELDQPAFNDLSRALFGDA